jgi:beta-galactosidase/beta-glucuronidase
MNIPRPEYPRPQFVRPEWMNLNGEWQFEIDPADNGLECGLLQRELRRRITVPFCPESNLSGIGNTGLMPAVWYRREVKIPSPWNNRRLLLHFGAIDYEATVWVDGVEVGRHRGGFSPMTCDLGRVSQPAETKSQAADSAKVIIVVRVRDSHEPPQARGKQSQTLENHGCFYTRTTGIWQTVWLEPVPEFALRRPRITPDVASSLFHIEQPLSKIEPGLQLHATVEDDAHGEIASARVSVGGTLTPHLYLSIPSGGRRLWSPRDPYLYQIKLELLSGSNSVIDQCSTYAGLREISIHGQAVLLNGEPIFQRLVLDQGFYPEGILTAPSDADLVSDIELSLGAGFNGARLHQKIFEERFLFHADRLGYLVWGEFADWGCAGYGSDHDHQKPTINYVSEWLEVLERDYSHPCIIGWAPLNETWQVLHDRSTVLDDATRALFLATKAFDTTRPVLDASGYSHRVPESDIYDSHDYEQDPVKFAQHHAGLAIGRPYISNAHGTHTLGKDYSVPYRGQPYFVSEFGGILWSPGRKDGWGYGDGPQTLEEFYERFGNLCRVLLGNPFMFGYCYTQLTDVFQEQNGLYNFDRCPKFDPPRLKAIQQQLAAIEAGR